MVEGESRLYKIFTWLADSMPEGNGHLSCMKWHANFLTQVLFLNQSGSAYIQLYL